MFIDRLLKPGALEFIKAGWSDAVNTLAIAERLRGAICFEINNVAEFYYEQTEKDDWYFEKDFPNITPPSDILWFEYAIPLKMRLPGQLMDNPQRQYLHKIGMLILSRDMGAKATPRWFCDASIFGEKHGVTSFFPVISWQVSPVGQCIPNHKGGLNLYVPDHWPKDKQKAVIPEASKWLHVPFLAMSFLHCKNVKRSELKTENRKSKRRNGGTKWGMKFYTLQINPLKEILRTEGQLAKTGLKRALHLCRGHFATYTEDAPLFGKVVGTFWKPMHVKGSIEHGIVEKNYSIKI